MKTVFTLALIMLLAPKPGFASVSDFDKAMAPIVTQYLLIHGALAGDKEAGVADAAKKIAGLIKKLEAQKVDGKHGKHYASVPKKLADAAKKLAAAKGIAKQREAYKELSRPMALWASMSKPKDLNVMFCSMAKGSWLQRDKTIKNPYYGAKMLNCGEVIAGPAKGKSGGHMKH